MKSSALIAAAFAAAAFAGMASAETIQPSGAADLCLDVGRGDASLRRCAYTESQDFRLPGRGGDVIETRNGCLVAPGENSTLTTARCTGRADQIWYMERGGAIVNRQGLCMDVDGGKIRDGQRVIAYRCNGRGNQQWAIGGGGPGWGGGGRPGDGGGYGREVSLSPQHAPGMCMDVSGGRSQLIIFACHGKKNQRFNLPGRGSGELRVKDGCVTGSGRQQQLFVSRCDGSDAQQWSYSRGGELRNANGLCADVNGAERRNNTPVIAFRCTGKANQSWNVQ